MKKVLLVAILISLVAPQLSYAALFDGLTAYWRFDDIVSGASTTDATGNGFSLLASRVTSTTTAKNGAAVQFNTSIATSSLYRGTHASIVNPKNFTFNCWAMPIAQPATNEEKVIMSVVSSSNNTGAFISEYADIGGAKRNYEVVPNASSFVAHTASLGSWYMYTTTSSTSGATLYRNASSVVTRTYGAFNNGYNGISIGNFIDSGGPIPIGRTWPGVIDECGVWDRILSSAEITALYNSGTGVFPTSTAARRIIFIQ